MNKMIRIIQTYLLIGFPLVLACMFWQTFSPDIWKSTDVATFTKIVWQALGINFMLWFVVLIIFLVMLVAFSRVREKNLRGLANLKERDEREEYITGKASRAAYISTLSLTIAFLFFSLVSFNIYRVPTDQAVNGKRTFASVSIGFSLQDKESQASSSPREILFSSKNFSLSTSSILILLLVWQLGIFNLAARKELN
jgi:phosphatidylglycerophosphate synthase